MERHDLIILENNLQVGDRVVIPKSLFDLIQHHVIYLGYVNGESWFIENKDGIGVRLITAGDFFTGVEKITRIERFIPTLKYTREDLFHRALNLIGEPYHVWNDNCETLANYLQHGKKHSGQIDFVKNLLVVVGLFMLIRAVAR